ncbi:hypothetical protein GKQ38_04475 [Candidatus Nanohaloarchaea archaeon]|nr:hypothetical protein GKQ38_04475 [Candidatus Nanohaloarchaea archaeon]
MAEPQEEYDTLVRGSLLRGVDERGEYTQASFQEDGVFVDIVRRPRGYELSFETDKGLKDIYEGIVENYHPKGLVEAINSEGDSFGLDPDAWNGGNYEDFVEAYFNFGNFSVEWFAIDDESEREYMVDVFSNTIHFDTTEPVSEAGWMIGEAVTDADSSLFDEVQRFLNED